MTPSRNSSSLHNSMQKALLDRQSSSSLRVLTTTPKSSIDFSSNDFLSLSTSPALRKAFQTELSSHPDHVIGSRGSRLLDGNLKYTEDLEQEIAAFHGASTGLLFNSGFDANAGFFASVPQNGDIIVYDEFIHASVHEGMRLSRAGRKVKFAHNCMAALRNLLEEIMACDEHVKSGERSVFIAVESLYSMDGDLAPLNEIVEIKEKIFPKGNAYIIVDEAHSNGIYGQQGKGLVSSLGLEKKVFARLHTFGKAIGCNGAILLCNELTRNYLINYARPLIYTTAMSFPSLAAIRASYSLLQSGATEPLMFHLHALIHHLYSKLQAFTSASGIPSSLLCIPDQRPESPIFALLTAQPRNLAKWCQDGGFMIRPIVAPTVPVGTERVRVCLHAGNTFEEIDSLIERIAEWLKAQARGSIDARAGL